MSELSDMQKHMMESDIEQLKEQKRYILSDFDNSHTEPTLETQKERRELEKSLDK